MDTDQKAPASSTETTDDRKPKDTSTSARKSPGQRELVTEGQAEGQDEQPPPEDGETKTAPDSTEQQRADRAPDAPSDPFEQRPSYGNFANLAEEFDARAKSREQVKAVNSQLEESKPDDEPQNIDFKVDDKSLREHIDPEADDANAAGSVEGEIEPAGDRTVTAIEEGENDERPGLEKFRGALHKNANDIVDKFGKSTDRLDSIFGPRPTGHAETRVDSGPTATDTHHSGMDPGNIVSAGLALGIVGAELFRRGREKIRGRDSQ
jgi:hypothetical protein